MTQIFGSPARRAAFLLAGLLAGTALADTKNVGAGQAFTTIASAIAAAVDGDVINIVDSVFTENAVMVTKSVTIQGQGASATTLQGATTRGGTSNVILNINGGAIFVTVKDLTLRHGGSSASTDGAIRAVSPTNVTIQNCIIEQNNTAGSGGAIFSSANSLTIANSTLRDNVAGIGGGLALIAGTVTVRNSTISGNSANIAGGGIHTDVGFSGSALLLENVTLSANRANESAGAVFANATAPGSLTVTARHCTITANHCDNDNSGGAGDLGGGIAQNNIAVVQLANSIVANNFRGSGDTTLSDLANTIGSLSFNLIGTTANATITGATNNIIGVDPLLNSLAANGSRPATHRPQAASPALNVIPAGSFLASDQRELARPQASGGDIGAHELVQFAVTGIAPSGSNPTNATSVTFTVALSETVSAAAATDFTIGSGPAGASITAAAVSGSNVLVTVNTGAGDGTLRLDVVDNDGILNANGAPLGDIGSGNGSFGAGQTLTIDKTAPTAELTSPASGTVADAITVSVTLSESTSAFDAADLTASNATISNFAGGGASYSFTLTPSAAGTFSVTVNAGAYADAAGNSSSASSTLARTFAPVADDPGGTDDPLPDDPADPTNICAACGGGGAALAPLLLATMIGAKLARRRR
jgi:Bacterial Ig-like domain